MRVSLRSQETGTVRKIARIAQSTSLSSSSVRVIIPRSISSSEFRFSKSAKENTSIRLINIYAYLQAVRGWRIMRGESLLAQAPRYEQPHSAAARIMLHSMNCRSYRPADSGLSAGRTVKNSHKLRISDNTFKSNTKWFIIYWLMMLWVRVLFGGGVWRIPFRLWNRATPGSWGQSMFRGA